MKTFEQWFGLFNESEDLVPVAIAAVDVETSTSSASRSTRTDDDGYSALMKDCDNIINSLAALSDTMPDAISESTEEELNESNPMTQVLMQDPIIMGALIGLTAITGAVIGTTKAAVDAKRNKKVAKEADKDFDKLAQLKMQEVKLEVAVREVEQKKKELASGSLEEADKDVKPKADNSKKKAALDKMKKKLDITIDNLKSKKDNMVSATRDFSIGLDTKYGPEKVYGFFSGKVKNLIAQKKDEILQEVTEYKIKVLGDTMDPAVKKDLTERIQKAKMSQKKRLTELKAEQKKESDKLQKAMKEDPAVAKEFEDNKDKLSPSDNKEEEETPKDTPDNSDEEDFDAYGDKEETKTDSKEEDEEDFDAYGEDEEETPKSDNSKEGMTKRIDAIIQKAEDSGDDNKIKKAKELKAKILAKESWQLENTILGKLFEAEIKKIELEDSLNENINLSIKDRFSKLI
tara:strand:+ start:204 stop:1583 length:1380 start_codon:yes stop_codon:yes gene_type:complete